MKRLILALVIALVLPVAAGPKFPGELKAIIDSEQIEELHSYLSHLEGSETKRGEVSFFDTVDRELYGKGVIVRLRKKDQRTDFTVKFRGSAPQDFPRRWLQDRDFDCEWDLLFEAANFSCSLKVSVESKGDFGRMLTRKQRRALETWLGSEIKNYAIVPYEPLQLAVIRWSQQEYGELNFEVWTDPRGEQIGEVSTKFSESERTEFHGHRQNLRAWLRDQDVQLAAEQLGKTRFGLRNVAR